MTVSAQWLRKQALRDARTPHDGPSWRWPVEKLVNETPKGKA